MMMMIGRDHVTSVRRCVGVMACVGHRSAVWVRWVSVRECVVCHVAMWCVFRGLVVCGVVCVMSRVYVGTCMWSALCGVSCTRSVTCVLYNTYLVCHVCKHVCGVMGVHHM